MAKILCIEDEVDFRESIVDLLEMEGHQTVTASDGEEGMWAIARERPELVLCDITMPRMDGFKLLETLYRAMPELSDTPFIFLTALSQKPDQLKGHALGAVDYMIKPVDFDLLMANVNSRLQHVNRYRRRVMDEANHLKGTLFEILSADLRTPVDAMITAADFACDPLVDISDKSIMESVAGMLRTSGQRLNRAIEMLLEAVATSGGILQLETDVFHAENLLTQSIGQVDDPGMAQRVSLTAPKTLPMIHGDMRLLSHSLTRIIEDMLQVRPPDEQIEVKAFLDDTGYQVIGVGMAQAMEEEAYNGSTELTALSLERQCNSGLPIPCGLTLYHTCITLMAHEGKLLLWHVPGKKESCLFLAFPRTRSG